MVWSPDDGRQLSDLSAVMIESWLSHHLFKSEMLAGSTAATCSWQDAVMRTATSNEGSNDVAELGSGDERRTSIFRQTYGLYRCET